jgi:site-specific DNA-adenine methylase
MKNHFIIGYPGNKRQEVEEIYKNINFKNIDTIIEPFCGSCSLSYYIWTLNKDKNFKYILNDSDKNLIELLKLIIDKKYIQLEDEINKIRLEISNSENNQITAKEIYKNYIKNDNVYSYLLKNKYYCMRPGIYPIRDYKKFNKKFDIEKYPIFDFLINANIEFYNIDGNDIIKNNNNKNSFIFLDPPYIASCNEFYKEDSNENTSNIYEYLYYSKLKNFKSKILICHENNWLFKILFKDYIKNSLPYYKKYETAQKKITTHICITNY